MPGTILGFTSGQATPTRRADRWLNFLYAYSPEQNIRDREDSPGARNPYNLWGDSETFGDETIGESVTRIVCFDDDIRFAGTKAFSYAIQGQCFNSVGAVVPGATVELYRAPNWDAGNGWFLVATTVADANGQYGFAVNDVTTQYKVEASIGGKGGVTARNIVGA